MTEVPSKLYVEAIKAIALVVLLLAGFRFSKTVARPFRALAARPLLAMLAVALLPVVVRLAILPLAPVPEPRIHDEFGHLLLAETFASGRITNPPHPHRRSFEAVYFLMEPTYTSQYQPALGLVLAAGILLFGHPWAGIVMSMAALAAALYWMLAGWVPARWALLGSAMAALQIGVFDYWMNTYWGGTVPALGGTLVLGALPRLKHARWRAVHAAVLAAGLAVVMNSRPLEALLLAAVVGGAVSWWLFGTRELAPGAITAQVVLPAALVLSATVLWMGYYNWRVTGRALQPPYMLHQKIYGTPQPFWWQQPVTVTHFRHKSIEDDYLRQRNLYLRRSSPLLMLKSAVSRVGRAWLFYLGVALAVPLLFIRRAWHDPQIRFVSIAAVPFVLDHLTFHAFYAHYAAPACALLYLAVVQCWRRMRLWEWKGRPAGVVLSDALPMVLALGLLLPIAGRIMEPVLPDWWRAAWRDEFRPAPARSEVVRQLEAIGGSHLVFVRYHYPQHHPDNEWVRNGAFIDNSPIVWARELDKESNLSLMRYYGNRKVWLLEPDVHPITLKAYSGATTHYVALAR